MTTQPLVSCIMPTRDRRPFAAQAIRYFLRQDYPNRELLIVDDGADPVADLVPAANRVRYLRLPGRHPLGAKRNLACQAARGELIAHWDDDDWIRADRLSVQVRALTDAGAAACGLAELLHYRSLGGDAWRYRPLPADPPWLAGGTLLYRRDAWAANPFPETRVGEDTTFVSRLPAAALLACEDAGWYVALLHPGNTGAKNLADPRWSPASLDAVSARLGGDRRFYAAVRSGRVGAGAAPRVAGAITLAADFLVYDGLGSMAEYLARGLARAGAAVNLAPLTLDREGLSGELLALLDRSSPRVDGPVLYASWIRPALDRFSGAELFIHTMWESSRLPASWTPRLNRARVVMVPTRFVADTTRASGVRAPVEVVPDGIDPAVYTYEHRPPRDGLTTLIVGTVTPRKHIGEGVAAWRLASGGDPDARLIIKSRFRQGGFRSDDPRIRFVDDSEPTRGIAHWYREADVLLALGSEGFGLPLVEGMATGLPVIALASEGQRDVCQEAGELLLPVEPARFEPCDEPGSGPCGVRGVPGVEDVAAKLHWVAAHREEAAAIGREASRWARTHRNVWAKGPAALEVLERHTRAVVRRRTSPCLPR